MKIIRLLSAFFDSHDPPICGIISLLNSIHSQEETTMAWTKPEFTDLRFGFEVTMYICNR
jgi:coenzyme PQQ precursor peptide PqqA